MTFARASVATYYDAAGVLQTAASGVPRFDHDPITHAPLGILMEREAENLITQSKVFTGPPWVCVTPNAANDIAGPTGNVDADRITGGGGSGYDMFLAVAGITPGRRYVYSVFVKLGTATNFCCIINNQQAWNTVGGQSFSAADGLSTTAWKRVSFSFIGPASGAINVHLGQHGQTGVAAQSAGTFYLADDQLEEDEMTSYTPTSGAAVRRLADVLRVDLPNGGYDVVVTDAAGSEVRSKTGAYQGYFLQPRAGQLRIQSAKFRRTGLSGLHPAAADAIQRGGISGAYKARMNEFVTESIAAGLWNRMTYIPNDSHFGGGQPIGGGGWSLNAEGGNRTNYAPTLMGGATYAPGGAVLSKTVGARSTQVIRSPWPRNPAHNPLVGVLARTTQAPSNVDAGFYTTVGQGLTVLENFAGYGLMGFEYSPAGSEANGYSPAINAPRLPDTDGFNASAVGDDLASGIFNTTLSAPSLLLARRENTAAPMTGVWNGIAKNRNHGGSNFTAPPNEYLYQVAPIYSGTGTGVQMGSFWFWGTRAEIEALPLEKLYAILATTLYWTGSPFPIVIQDGQSNATIETLVAAARRADGYGTATRMMEWRNHNIGGNPLSRWLVASPTGSRVADSNTAFNTPVRGENYVAGMAVFGLNLPSTPIAKSRTVMLNLWNHGESDTELALESGRYRSLLGTLFDFREADFNGIPVKHALVRIDYDPIDRTGSGSNLPLSGLTGAASGANGTYAITAATGKTDFFRPYVFTKGTYVLQIAGGNWELRNSGTLIMTGSATNAAHPELVTAWTFPSGGGTPTFGETRYTGNVERVRQGIDDVAADRGGLVIESRDFLRPNDDVHWYPDNDARSTYAGRVHTTVEMLAA